MSKKIGRNDPCPCGSGLKYKKCCGANEKSTSRNDHKGRLSDFFKLYGLEDKDITEILSRKKPLPLNTDLVELKSILSLSGQFPKIQVEGKQLYPTLDLHLPMKIIPTSVHFVARQSDDLKKAMHLNSSVICNERLIDALGWKKRHDKYKEYNDLFDDTFGKIAQPYDMELLSYPNIKGYVAKAVWNETDQGILRYKGQLYNVVIDRIESILTNFEDRLTAACIVRQLIEIVINSVFFHWVLLVAHENLKLAVAQTAENFILFDVFFPDFVQTLSDWPKAGIKRLNNNIKQMIAIHKDPNYKPPQLNRKILTYEEKRKWAKHTVDGVDKQINLQTGTLSESVETLHGQYSFLNGFVHPSSQIFPVVAYYSQLPGGFRDTDVQDSIQVSAIKTIYHSLRLMKHYVFNEIWDKTESFEKLSTAKVTDLLTCSVMFFDTMNKPEWFLKSKG